MSWRSHSHGFLFVCPEHQLSSYFSASAMPASEPLYWSGHEFKKLTIQGPGRPAVKRLLHNRAALPIKLWSLSTPEVKRARGETVRLAEEPMRIRAGERTNTWRRFVPETAYEQQVDWQQDWGSAGLVARTKALINLPSTSGAIVSRSSPVPSNKSRASAAV